MSKFCDIESLKACLKRESMDSSAIRDALTSALNTIAISGGNPDTVNRIVDCLAEHLAPSGHTTSQSEKKDVEIARDGTQEQESDDVVFARVHKAIAQIKAGGFVVVADADDRENEGDLIIAAEKATAEKLAFMVNQTSGLICVGVHSSRLDELKLPQMVDQNTEYHGTAFTVSVDLKFADDQGRHTGISAGDRASTIRALADPKFKADDFNRPGHMFPLRYREGGVLVRPGHTEASVDLARLAGLFPAGAMCEIVNKDGSMMRPPDCRKFATRFNLPFLSIPDIIRFRKSFPRFPAPEMMTTLAPAKDTA